MHHIKIRNISGYGFHLQVIKTSLSPGRPGKSYSQHNTSLQLRLRILIIMYLLSVYKNSNRISCSLNCHVAGAYILYLYLSSCNLAAVSAQNPLTSLINRHIIGRHGNLVVSAAGRASLTHTQKQILAGRGQIKVHTGFVIGPPVIADRRCRLAAIPGAAASLSRHLQNTVSIFIQNCLKGSVGILSVKRVESVFTAAAFNKAFIGFYNFTILIGRYISHVLVIKIIRIQIGILQILCLTGFIRIQNISSLFRSSRELQLLLHICHIQSCHCHNRPWLNGYIVASALIGCQSFHRLYIIFIVKLSVLSRTSLPYCQLGVCRQIFKILRTDGKFLCFSAVITDNNRKILSVRRCQSHIIISAVSSVNRVCSAGLTLAGAGNRSPYYVFIRGIILPASHGKLTEMLHNT